MTTWLPCASMLYLLPASFAWSQQANVNLDHDPQKNRENLVPFSAPLNSPDVRDDRTVTFRLKAPAAKDVRLVGVAILTALARPGNGVPFTKGADGIWTLTVGALRPDIYAYHFNVDGVQIADPSNTHAAFTAMPPPAPRSFPAQPLARPVTPATIAGPPRPYISS